MRYLLQVLILTTFISTTNGQDTKDSLSIDAILSLKRVSDVQVSPNEQWVAYTVSAIDTAKDKSFKQIWMVSTEGGNPVLMTAKETSASRPRWSPDLKSRISVMIQTCGLSRPTTQIRDLPFDR